MKKTIIFSLISVIVVSLFYFLYSTDLVVASKQADTAGIPEIVVADPDFKFGTVLEGEKVTHAYVIENRGTVPLTIENVRTSCGCTTAQKPEVVAPGAKERIVVQGNTQGYGGRGFHKTITVTTNDPKHPEVRLHLNGKVAQFARIDPRHILLRGHAGDALAGEAVITPSEKYPFKIVKTTLDKKLVGNISVDLSEKEGVYHVAVRNLAKTRTYYGGNIVFATDSKVRPQLSIHVTGRLDAEVSPKKP